MLSKVEELKLISRCVLADDRRAFGELVEAYQPRLRRFFMNLTLGDEYLSDDLAQETFIKAYIELRSFRGMSRFGTWLFRIGYNEFYSYKRSEHATTDLDHAPERASSPVDSSEISMDVKVAMAQLSEIERTVVTLFYIDDMPVKQIATITGLNQSTLRSHLHRAKEKMAKTLKQE
ncbi:MAG: sigma-70 family RNA polymerase sigma factor [Muribaculaceae bacterium]|nr:sigma-70 family RNA polymerase sigma factor [Muribaculaceae bacterium]MBR0025350.1 sigma-70 family RNA polymerase sigma factor [Muribaculaceae bacterium]